ncbi:(2Fe-2S)-binding protein [Lacipirellula sp.]|uniref:(2Fe-2S)-binding protein n=1 Tax=Lacipirellula sp. TaxID=2691419 RepID=UPI003D0B8E7E
MQPDDELCLCFHVTRRKVENFIRIERPCRAGQMAECFGAGTGCGWCRPFLQRLFEKAQAGQGGTPQPAGDDLPSAADYAHSRGDYVRAGGGVPPAGATPIDAE